MAQQTRRTRVDTWVGSYEAIAAGEFETVDPAVATILGRAASDLATYISARPPNGR